MQTEADQVMHALAGWPQCWACMDYQRPLLMRVNAMRRQNTDMCLCTPCRKEKVRCTSCAEPKERWAMFWKLESKPMAPWPATASAPQYATHGLWRGSCAPCARRQAKYRDVPFLAYPNGTPKLLPRARYHRYRYRSRTKR